MLRPDIADPVASIRTEAAAMQALKGKELGFLQFFNSHRWGAAAAGHALGGPLHAA